VGVSGSKVQERKLAGQRQFCPQGLAVCAHGLSGPSNAAAMEEHVKKVVLLSHSSAENLTKHWLSTTTLETDRKKFCVHHAIACTWIGSTAISMRRRACGIVCGIYQARSSVQAIAEALGAMIRTTA
jgi:hypothetical protein